LSIPVAGGLDRVGVDVIKFPCSSRAKRCVVAFIDLNKVARGLCYL